MERNRNVVKVSILIASIFVFFFSISYAFLNQTVTGTKKQVITAGNLELGLVEGDTVTLENALPVYDEVGMIQTPFTFHLTNKTEQPTNYTLRLKNVTADEKEKLDTSLVKYGLTKDGEVVKDFLSNLKENILDKGSIPGNGTISYSLRLWIDSSVEDEILIKDKTLSYKIEVEARQEVILYPETASELVGVNLGEDCKTYDDGIDTFLVGQCKNNYVWYSGKLWRVVLKNNETGAVKMITDNAITSISYNASKNSTFADSYADQWLSQEFLPTLHNYEDYLVVNSVWDVSNRNYNVPPTRLSNPTLVTRAVGLLNFYEFYTIYNKSDGSNTNYLNNGENWWLLTPNGGSYVYYVSNGAYTYNGTLTKYGIRPVVNLQNNIRITSGTGTQINPYRLAGDGQKTVNGTTLLSTRYSGEYIHFNNDLYRIVGTQNHLTKITAVDKPAELIKSAFRSDNTVTNFANSDIKTDLEDYYQNHVASPYKSMIKLAPWYLGKVGNTTNHHYKASICKTIDAKVGTSTWFFSKLVENK